MLKLKPLVEAFNLTYKARNQQKSTEDPSRTSKQTIGHAVMRNNTIIEHYSDLQISLSANQLIQKVRVLPQIAGIVHCQTGILANLKTQSIPVVNIERDLSKSKGSNLNFW